MRRSMLDILACPIDKYYPLELVEIDTVEDKTINENVIKEGVLFCSQCSRFYPIIEEIPVMLPDELRDKEKDIQFLQKWHEKIPSKIIKNGNPWHL
ncbi:MAG TPA: Trm112 family protein [Nitrososphaeraceae archaeon]|nr:Trm112 family protein [Nitrososphaeraceae archaeon]